MTLGKHTGGRVKDMCFVYTHTSGGVTSNSMLSAETSDWLVLLS